MLDRLEQLARSGNKEAAQRLLEQLQSMLENLQMAQPNAGDDGGDDMNSALDELSDMIRKQQQLRDKTFKKGQDLRRDRRAATTRARRSSATCARTRRRCATGSRSCSTSCASTG